MPPFDREGALKSAEKRQGRIDLAHAIEWLERAAAAPATDVSRSLMCDLARTLESERSRALAVAAELESESDGDRDASAQIGRLSKVQARG